MKDNKLYLYVAGMATGVIMSVFSLFIASRVIIYISEGGSLLPLILLAIFLGLGMGGLISFFVNKLSK
jgi:hypothetical protein